jgi:hypothetical protein
MGISLSIASSGAIPNLAALIDAVQEELDRDDLAAKIPQFVQFVEAIFNREIRAPQMERTSLATTSGEDTQLPDDYLAMRAIYEEGSPDRPLRGISPTAIRQISDGTAGTPVAYTLVSNGIRLIPPPSGTILLSMDYFARIEALSTYNPSNWLLEQHPDAYFYGVLYCAEHNLKNSSAALEYKQLMDEAIGRINKTSRNDRYGAGPLVPTGVNQVRGSRC